MQYGSLHNMLFFDNLKNPDVILSHNSFLLSEISIKPLQNLKDSTLPEYYKI